MAETRHPWQRMGIWLTEAAIAGAPMIPLFIFVTSFIQHEGNFTYVLPFVLFYAFNKAGEYTLGVFGRVRNPYRMARIAAALTALGAAISLGGGLSVILYDVGATVIGCGTSVFGTMYRTVKGQLKKDGTFPGGRPELMGFLLMVLFSSLILIDQGALEELVIACYVGLSLVSLATMRSLPVSAEERDQPLFDRSERDPRKIIPALCLLGLAFFVRLYKQTANLTDVLVLMVLASAVLVAVIATRRYATRQYFEYHGVLYSEFLIVVILWDVFWFIGQNDIPAVLVANLCQFAGQFAGMALGSRILGLLEGRVRQSNLLLLLTMVVGALFLVPALNFPCVFLIAFLSQLGHLRVGALYRKHEQRPAVELNLVTQKMTGIGIIAGQTILVVVLTIVSLVTLHDGSAAMASYALRIPGHDLTLTFDLTRLITMAILWAQGVALLVIERLRQGTILKPR